MIQTNARSRLGMIILIESNTFSGGCTRVTYKEFDDVQISDLETPDFVRIKKKKSKRISPLQ